MRTAGNAVQDKEYLDTAISQDEFLLTRLRTDHGIHFQEWRDTFAEPFPEQLRTYFEHLKSEHPNWIYLTEVSIRLTEEGWLFTDTIIGEAVECLISD
jgi:coproporphyrinogen III oxidase-like Fe-S oxidoreductase